MGGATPKRVFWVGRGAPYGTVRSYIVSYRDGLRVRATKCMRGAAPRIHDGTCMASQSITVQTHRSVARHVHGHGRAAALINPQPRLEPPRYKNQLVDREGTDCLVGLVLL